MMSDLKNPLNLSQDDLELLEQALQTFSELGTELPPRLLRYLVDSDDEAAVEDTVSAIHDQLKQYQQNLQRNVQSGQLILSAQFVSSSLPFSYFSVQNIFGDNPLNSLLSSVIASDVGFYCRLSQVLCSCFGSRIDASGQVQLPSLKERLPQFLKMIVSPDYGQVDSNPVCGVTAGIIDAMYVEAGEPAGIFAKLEEKGSNRKM